MAVEVHDAIEASRYEARVDAQHTVAGFASYVRAAEFIVFVHTEVGPRYEGGGVRPIPESPRHLGGKIVLLPA